MLPKCLVELDEGTIDTKGIRIKLNSFDKLGADGNNFAVKTNKIISLESIKYK